MQNLRDFEDDQDIADLRKDVEDDQNIAATLCHMLDCLGDKGYFGGKSVEEIKGWIRSRSAFYIAARQAGLAELVQGESSLSLNLMPIAKTAYA
jgi:hypothetical protein